METNDVNLAILNITSWVGQCGDATHLYGSLILCRNVAITIDSVDDWGVGSMGYPIELFRPLTMELAIQLDKKDGGKTYQRQVRALKEHPEIQDKMPNYGTTNRFDTFDQVVEAGIKKWKELNLKCPFISLYEGEKYKANEYEPSSTIILQYGENLK